MNIAAKTFGKGYRRGPTALSSQYSLNGRGALRPASGFRARFTSRGRARATSVGLRPPSVTHANIMARRSKESNPQAQGQGITVDQTGHLRHDLNASVASLRGVAVFIGISGRFRRNTQLDNMRDLAASSWGNGSDEKDLVRMNAGFRLVKLIDLVINEERGLKAGSNPA